MCSRKRVEKCRAERTIPFFLPGMTGFSKLMVSSLYFAGKVARSQASPLSGEVVVVSTDEGGSIDPSKYNDDGNCCEPP